MINAKDKSDLFEKLNEAIESKNCKIMILFSDEVGVLNSMGYSDIENPYFISEVVQTFLEESKKINKFLTNSLIKKHSDLIKKHDTLVYKHNDLMKYIHEK